MNLDVNAVSELRASLWSAGYRPVPVFNANHTGINSPGKQPLGDKWQLHARMNPPFCATCPAVPHALNTGVLADGLRPLDLDIDDPEKARECRATASRMFGPIPTRSRCDTARVLLLCRAAEGEPAKRTLTGRSHTTEHSCKIEVLGRGQQFVAFGRHPSGADLEWSPDGPGVLQYDELPEVTEDDIQAFLEACAPIIDAPVPGRPNGHDHEHDHTSADPQADSLRIAAALAEIPNHGPADWEAWNRVGMAVWRATGGSSAGWEAFNAWSGRNQAYNADATRTRWDHYTTSPPTSIGAGTILHMAAESAGRPFVDPDDPGYQADAGSDASDGLRPTIRCAAGKVDVLADAAERALLQARTDIFQRADRLVRPGHAEVSAADGRTTIAAGLYEINDAALIEELTRVAIWEKYNVRAKDFVKCDPPPLVANVLAARKGRWRLRSVAGVLTCPTLRPDGSILSEPGYDPATRLYYMPDNTLRMPSVLERPSKREAEQGLETINELLIDFKFVGEVDRAVALSLIVSSVVRGALHMVPLHAFTAPTPGSGKSYLADITTAIVSGRYCPVITPGRSEEELEKRLGSMLLSGCPTISLDNISSELTGDALCQVTERPTVRIRILGKSETPECEFRGIVIANGNNLVVAGDMTRRVVIGKLDTGLERPEGREFKCDPVRTVLADRGKYIAAALTIVRAYITADKPDKLIPLASYTAWSDLVRSSLVWLGNADPVVSMQEARDDDPVLTTLHAALVSWRAAFGDAAKTTSEVATKLSGFDPNTPEGKTLLNLREALAPVASVRNVIDAIKLRYWLRKSKGRPVGGLKFTGTSGHGGVIAWKATKVG